MDTTAHQATMHSSSHKVNDVSEARRDSPPDHQTPLRNNVAASDFRGQTENKKSETVKSGPISSRTRSKKAAQASSVPVCATVPVYLHTTSPCPMCLANTTYFNVNFLQLFNQYIHYSGAVQCSNIPVSYSQLLLRIYCDHHVMWSCDDGGWRSKYTGQ